MRTFKDLSEGEQKQAVNVAASQLLEAVCEGAIRFDDRANGDDLQARIDKAGAEAERMRTPWFVGEYIMDTCRDDILSMARTDAEDALYPDKGERVIRL